MILYRWRGAFPNFGDELNTILWPALLPGFFDGDDTSRFPGRFLGIGSILDNRHPPRTIKYVAGAGYGGYEGRPRLDETWRIQWVRGPRTATALGLPRTLGLGDPASLLPVSLDLRPHDGRGIGFMPHFESAARGAWRQAAHLAGLRLIDPREPPSRILDAMLGCRLLLSEALHGIIIADALRIPWIAIRPRARVHRAKWFDWSETADLVPRFHVIPASSAAERVCAWPPYGCHPARQWLDRHHSRFPGPDERLIGKAAEALSQAAKAEPQLSCDSALDRCQSRMLDAVQGIRRNHWKATPALTWKLWTRSCLRDRPETAYEVPVTG